MRWWVPKTGPETQTDETGETNKQTDKRVSENQHKQKHRNQQARKPNTEAHLYYNMSIYIDMRIICILLDNWVKENHTTSALKSVIKYWKLYTKCCHKLATTSMSSLAKKWLTMNIKPFTIYQALQWKASAISLWSEMVMWCHVSSWCLPPPCLGTKASDPGSSSWLVQSSWWS